MSIRQKIILLSLVVLVGNGIIGYAVYKSNEKLQESEQWVQHSEQIIYQSSIILSLSKDLETASRGFVITNDSTFLEPLYSAQKIIFASIGILRQLTLDNPIQKQLVDSLSYYMQKRLNFTLKSVELRRDDGLASAIVFISTKQGKFYSDILRKTTNAIQKEENSLLNQRKETNKRSVEAFNTFSLIMFTLMTVFTILMVIVTGKYLFQNKEKEKRAAELIIADEELVFQNKEKEKRAEELLIANEELIFQNEQKERKAEELIVANKELIFQTEEKQKRADELIIANKELIFQTKEKQNRADELAIANKELIFQNEEKEKRAEELIIANKELVFQNEEKEKRAAELITAYKKLVYQNEEKEKRANELVIADKELVYQNEEKEKRAEELIIADKELVYQNEEKEKRAEELIIAKNERDFQSDEKDKQEAANKELEAFSYSVSHDLRAPLRHIGGFVDLLVKNNSSQLDETGLRYLNIISESSHEMGNLIDALLTFSRLSRVELQRTNINSKKLVNHVLETFSDELDGREVEINLSDLPDIMGDESLINQVWINLISNALKYTRNKEKAVIDIGGKTEDGFTAFYIRDNGAGFDMKYADKLFGVFQRLHKAKDFEGIGIGLANVNRIVIRHGGKCRAESEVGTGAAFFFNIPNNKQIII